MSMLRIYIKKQNTREKIAVEKKENTNLYYLQIKKTYIIF